MNPVRVAGPSTSPVTLAEMKAAARVDFGDDDLIMQSYLDAAVDHLDGWSGILSRAIIDQDWRIDLAQWPSCAIALPFGDVSAAVVKYLDPDGIEQDLQPDTYELSETATGSVLRFRRSFHRPPLADDRSGAIRVTFTTGYGPDAADVPPSIKVAILLLACHWYENRETVGSQDMRKLPFTVDALITPHRRVLF